MNVMTAERPAQYGLDELNLEARMGGVGIENRQREVRRIDLSDFENRRAEITEQLWSAAREVGFFQLVNHGIDLGEVKRAFKMSEAFFALPEHVKARLPLKKGCNAGWESKAQVRPSTRTPDQKESYQITRPHMDDLWPTDEELPEFRTVLLDFERKCWETGMKVLSCFADRLGFERDFFAKAHDQTSKQYQSTLRLLHYFAIPPEFQADQGLWRAGAHTDFDVLTLLFQREGQGGLQVCPGMEVEGQEWTSVEPADEVITCNIGDMLMRWSDDLLPSNFHRVRCPYPDEYQGARYSVAFFCQANKDVMIQGPAGKYPPISGGDYLNQRVNANFAKY